MPQDKPSAAHAALTDDQPHPRTLHRGLEPAWTWPISPVSIAVVAAVFIFALYLYFGTGSSLFDRDEPRFSRAAVEMVRSGDYLVPTFDGRLRPDKPVLIYWLMSLGIHTFGVSTLAVRLPSMIATAASCLLCFFIARKLFGPRTGLVSMAMLALAPLMMLDGAAAISDATLLVTILASFAVFLLRQPRGFTWRWAVLMGLMLGLAQLAKGPVALAVVVLGCATMVWKWPLEMQVPPGSDPASTTPATPETPSKALSPTPGTRAWRRQQWLGLGLALLVSMVIFLAWAIPANNATGGELARLGLGRHVGERMISPQEGHGGSNLVTYAAMLPFYIAVIAVGFAPWMLFLFASVPMLRRARQDQPGYAVLAGWFLPTFILMTLVATKLPHYILPTVPALAIACSAWIVAFATRPTFDPGGLSRIRTISHFTTFGGAIAAIGIIVAMWGGALGGWFDGETEPWAVFMAPLAWPASAIAWTLLLMVGGGWLMLRLRRAAGAALWMGVTMLMLMVLLGGWMLPTLEQFKPSTALADVALQPSYRDLPLATFEYDEPSLRFYADRLGSVEALENEAALKAWLLRPGKGLLVIDRERLMPVMLRVAALKPQTVILHLHFGFTSRSSRRLSSVLLLLREPPANTAPATLPTTSPLVR